jgi:hypothetical protein
LSVAAARPQSTRALWRAVWTLGITQIIAWGSLHYSIAVLAPDMGAALGIRLHETLAGFVSIGAVAKVPPPAERPPRSAVLSAWGTDVRSTSPA